MNSIERMREVQTECSVIIAVATACWRPVNPSYSWHVLQWLCWRQRCRHPLMRKSDGIVNLDPGT